MKNKYFSGLLFVIGTCFSFSAQSQIIVSPKSGIADWETKDVNISGTTMVFKRGYRPSIGLEYGYMFDNNVSLGAELTHEDLDSDSIWGRDDADVTRFMGVAKYSFRLRDGIEPYIGIGMGWVGMDISGSIITRFTGYSYMGRVGIFTPISRRMGVSMEIRNAYLSMNDGDSNEFKSHINEVFISLNILIDSVQ